MMAAMLAAVDDGVGELVDELKRCGIYEDTCVFFQSDNGPSRESRNWLDGTPDLYYGGRTGGLKGHKFSLFEGGIRVPGIFSWPGKIPAGQVIDEPCGAMDVFPTLLAAAGGDAGAYSVDGENIWGVLTEGAASPHDCIFWEMDQQTAVRRGKYKLVLDGFTEEGVPAEDAVFLADLEADPGETVNLAAELPELTAELREKALAWRAALEANWEKEFAANYKSLT